MTNKINLTSKYNLKTKILEDPIYLNKVLVIVGNRYDLQKYLDENYTKEEWHWDVTKYNGSYLGLQDRMLWLWIEDSANWYVLVHECIHLVLDIYKRAKVNTNIALDQEPFAYYHGYWIRTIWEYLEEINEEDNGQSN